MSATRPSMTAAVVAATLLLLRDDAELAHLVDQRSLDAIERAVRHMMPVAGWALDHVPWSVLKRVGFGLERALSPSFVTHYALRKSEIRARLDEAIGDGCRQVVLLGAGFDMLSASIPEHVRVFELELPATQQAKRDALQGLAMRSLEFVPIDLSRASLHDVLHRTAGFDPSADTTFVAEGLLMYLDLETVERAFTDIARAARRTRAIISFVTPDRNGRVRLHSQRSIVDRCMTYLGEEFVWGDNAARIQERLEHHGLRVDRIVSNADLHDTLPRTARRRSRRSSGEVIVVASNRGFAAAQNVPRTPAAEGPTTSRHVGFVAAVGTGSVPDVSA